ncbi:MFS transporter [Nocardioides sp. NPDC058538]|uniref:MFS transporter n=1 Tax=Nocardioides sp. NPDC058538 TaxID=3346542 RepID=UPI0036693E83
MTSSELTRSVLDEPATPAPKLWVAAISLANVGLFTAWFGPILTLLGMQAERFAGDDKEAALAWVVGIGALCSTVANPVFGALSDRTTSRYGRRLPWSVLGICGGAASLVLLAFAPNLVVVAVGWCLAQIALNANFAAITAAVPDHAPHQQRGTIGGFLGLAQTVGAVVGAGLAAAAGGIVGGYLACAVFLVIASAPYVAMRRDLVLDPADRPAFSWGTFLRGFWISPRLHPDFAWAWLTRFLMNLGFSIGLVYLLFYLDDAVHHENPEAGVFLLSAVNSLALLVTVVAGGWLSDRLDRRRIFVTVAGVVMAAGTLSLAGFHSWTAAIIGVAVLGLGMGVFTSVDLALMIDVLPEALDRGKDLGVVNIANSLPQVLAPVVAAPIVSVLGGYSTLYAVAAGVTLAGAVLVYRIKSVR